MVEKKESAKVEAQKAHDSVAKKTIPELRDEADSKTFVKDYLVHVDNSSKVADEVHENNKKDVVDQAIQRGLLSTGDVKLDSADVQDEHNVLLTYSVAVKLNEKTN